MKTKVLNFIKYNNAFTLIFGMIFFGCGITFAASPDARESVYGTAETITSIDNTWFLSVDLNTYNFNLKINSVTEDEKNYYAVYSYQTILIEESVWQNKELEKTLTISKDALGERDLGLYIAKELGENINYELSYLKKVQAIEKAKGESRKVVTIEYSGLIGKLLDPKEEVIDGYQPVIPEPIPEAPVRVEENPAEVIVSTEYPPAEVPPASEPSSSKEEEGSATEVETVPPVTETPPAAESETEIATPTSEPAPENITVPDETSPSPEEMINEDLVVKVVEALVENNVPSAEEPAVPQPENNSTES